MFLKNIKLSNFKNYSETEFLFSEKVNGIVGENGCGKTNLLDAIHYLSFCKSFFTPQDSFSIKFECDFFAIHGEFVSFDLGNSTKVSCAIKSPGRKIMKANQKEYSHLSDHIGLFPLVMVSPYDHDIINEGSETRRKFFDMIISQFDKDYLHHLISYQKIINQRNNLLKNFIENHNFEPSLLSIFDEQLLTPGYYIFGKRKDFIDSIRPIFQEHYKSLSGNKEIVDICYESGLMQNSMEKGFEINELADRKSGYTNFGIHKDDYIFQINDKSVKRFGSQGQQKSFALALKLSQFDYIHARKGIKPILLLDDIFDKLDKKRTSHLLDLVGQKHFGQVFITDTNEVRVKEILESHNIENKIFNLTK